MKKRLILLVCLVPILAACAGSAPLPSPTSSPPSAAPARTPSPAPIVEANPAVDLARAQLKQALGLSDESLIVLASVEAVEWPDACLGVAVSGGMCAQVITPGYKIVFAVNGVNFEVHTDLAGQNIQLADPPGTSFQPPPPAVQSVVDLLRTTLAGQLRLPMDEVRRVAWQEKTWDGCLGVYRPDEICTMIALPGYRIILGVGNSLYVYHTNQDNSQSRLAAAPSVESRSPVVLQWSASDPETGTCLSVAMYADGRAAFGECGLPQLVTALEAARAARLTELAAEFAAFEADTAAGHIAFNGAGGTVASEAERRALAEWARLVGMELRSGRSGAAWGMGVAWHREGGIAGVCQDMVIYLSGEFIVSDCRAGQDFERGRLDAGSLAELYQWIDRYRGFEFNSAPPAGSADMFTDYYQLSGRGAGLPSAVEQEQIAEWLGRLHARLTSGG